MVAGRLRKKIAAVFEQADQASPSIIVLDEVDAFLSARDDSAGGQHRVEEVAEFLRRIPLAQKNKVLVVAMTNRKDALDPAVLRRGRFDHILEVGMPSAQEALSALRKSFCGIALGAGVDLEQIAARLGGRPLSDAGFVVREASRLSARAGREDIGLEELTQAADSLPSSTEKPPTRKIGFV